VAAPTHPIVLFTAFEPSGDALAAPVIAELRQTAPALRVMAWGGPKMEAAGATLLARTAEDGAMGLGSLARVRAVQREIAHIKRWSQAHRVVVHVPVDSPAANFPICRALRRRGVKTVHLAAPQLWAWGRWRLGKLRRLTDMVLCLLPFEEQWFKDRGVPARFVGHPVINRAFDAQELRDQMHGLPQGAPRIALFPGSRLQEVRANLRVLRNTYEELQSRYQGASGLVVAAHAGVAKVVRRKMKVFPTNLHMVTGQVDAVISWCDLALAVSGTITLDLARQQKPMIGVYKTGILSWIGAKLLLRTPHRLLPNIIAEREIAPEFVPHVGGAGPLIREASRYLSDSKHAALQSEELRRVCLRFANKQPAREAAAAIVKVLKGEGG
jgi:lipid-A-disaccharide synthase